jgi:deazaflavin-dependent oxidoreductase (nitroreductase family)
MGNVFWIVAEHGAHAQYVKNIRANARVRVRVDGGWRSGTAEILADDDPLQRQRTLDPRTASEVRRFGTDLLTIRIDLDPVDN